MPKIKYSPIVFGNINLNQFMIFLAGIIIVGIVYLFSSFYQFVFAFLIICGVCIRAGFKFRNNIDLTAIDEAYLKDLKLSLKSEEYRNLIKYFFADIKRRIRSEKNMIINLAEKGAKRNANLENRLMALERTRELLKKEVEKEF